MDVFQLSLMPVYIKIITQLAERIGFVTHQSILYGLLGARRMNSIDEDASIIAPARLAKFSLLEPKLVKVESDLSGRRPRIDYFF